MTDHAPDLRNVKPYEWSDEQAVDFEVAQDTISLFIAACTSRYWDERRKEAPDPAVLEYWDDLSKAASERRHALRSDDPAAIRDALRTYAPQVRALLGGSDG